MSNDAPLDQMRADLLGRKRTLAEELAEIEEGLKALDTFAAVYSRLTRKGRRNPSEAPIEPTGTEPTLRDPQPIVSTRPVTPGPRGGHAADVFQADDQTEPEKPKADSGFAESKEVPKTTFVLQAATDLGSERFYDPVVIRSEVNRRFRDEMGQELTQDQVSVSLRNLARTGKIRLLRAGGPRKPAIYANPDYRGPGPGGQPTLEDVSPERIGAETEESEKGVEAV